MQKIISASGLCLGYEGCEKLITDAKFDIYANDFVFITGQSGSGSELRWLGRSRIIQIYYFAMSRRVALMNTQATLSGDFCTRLRSFWVLASWSSRTKYQAR